MSQHVHNFHNEPSHTNAHPLCIYMINRSALNLAHLNQCFDTLSIRLVEPFLLLTRNLLGVLYSFSVINKVWHVVGSNTTHTIKSDVINDSSFPSSAWKKKRKPFWSFKILITACNLGLLHGIIFYLSLPEKETNPKLSRSVSTSFSFVWGIRTSKKKKIVKNKKENQIFEITSLFIVDNSALS